MLCSVQQQIAPVLADGPRTALEGPAVAALPLGCTGSLSFYQQLANSGTDSSSGRGSAAGGTAGLETESAKALKELLQHARDCGLVDSIRQYVALRGGTGLNSPPNTCESVQTTASTESAGTAATHTTSDKPPPNNGKCATSPQTTPHAVSHVTSSVSSHAGSERNSQSLGDERHQQDSCLAHQRKAEELTPSIGMEFSDNMRTNAGSGPLASQSSAELCSADVFVADLSAACVSAAVVSAPTAAAAALSEGTRVSSSGSRVSPPSVPSSPRAVHREAKSSPSENTERKRTLWRPTARRAPSGQVSREGISSVRKERSVGSSSTGASPPLASLPEHSQAAATLFVAMTRQQAAESIPKQNALSTVTLSCSSSLHAASSSSSPLPSSCPPSSPANHSPCPPPHPRAPLFPHLTLLPLPSLSLPNSSSSVCLSLPSPRTPGRPPKKSAPSQSAPSSAGTKTATPETAPRCSLQATQRDYRAVTSTASVPADSQSATPFAASSALASSLAVQAPATKSSQVTPWTIARSPEATETPRATSLMQLFPGLVALSPDCPSNVPTSLSVSADVIAPSLTPVPCLGATKLLVLPACVLKSGAATARSHMVASVGNSGKRSLTDSPASPATPPHSGLWVPTLRCMPVMSVGTRDLSLGGTPTPVCGADKEGVKRRKLSSLLSCRLPFEQVDNTRLSL